MVHAGASPRGYATLGDFGKLFGIVEVGHACIGGTERNKHLRYLNEFSGNANTRNMKDHERVNQALSRVIGLRLAYEQLIGGEA